MKLRNPVQILFVVSISTAGMQVAAEEDSTPDTKSGYEESDSIAGPSGVSQELVLHDDYRDTLFEPNWSKTLFTPWFDWKRHLNDDYGLKFGFNVLLLGQKANTDGNTGEDSSAGGIYRFQGTWTTFSNETSVGGIEWRIESRKNIGSVPAPQTLGSSYVVSLNTGFPYSDNFDIDTAVLSWKQFFTKQRWGYAAGRLAFDMYLDPTWIQSPYRGFMNRSFVVNPALATTGVGALGVVTKGFVSENVWLGAQIYDGNAVNGDFDWDTVQEGEYLKAVEFGWTPAYGRRATDKVQFTYWDKDERKAAGISGGSGWAVSATQQLNDDLLFALRFGSSDGGAGVAAESAASLGFEYKPWKQRALSFGLGWAEPSEETYGEGLKDEWLAEVSYKMQLTQNFSLTPDVQYLRNPTQLPGKDSLWVFGARLILTL